MSYESATEIEKMRCYKCDKELDRTEPAVEFTQTLWVNGYWQKSSESRFFCQSCSKNGFELTPKVEGQ